MAMQSIKAEVVKFPGEGGTVPTAMQCYMMRRFHPRALFVSAIAITWAIFLFWHHQWLAALAVVVADRLIGTALSRNMDYQSFGQTSWGRLALLHLNPANLTIQLVGVIVALYGIWVHSTIPILIGVSVIFLGHLFGWNRVFPFSQEAA